MRSTRPIVGVVPARSLLPFVGVALLALAACDVPEAPEWDVGLLVPFSSDPVSIADFLPLDENGDTIIRVAQVNGQEVFIVDVQEDSVAYSLGRMCSDCRALQGQTVSVPSFDYVDTLDVRYPQELVSIEILSARLGSRLRNGLNFDPLRPNPNPDAAGYLAIAVRGLASGTLLDSVFISGATESLAAGSDREFLLALNDVEITDGLRTIFYVHSPEDGQTIQIDTAMDARLGSFIDQIQVRAITALVETDTLEENFMADIDEDLKDEIRDRVQSGSYELELVHNLEVAGVFEVSIAGSEADLFSGDPAREVRLDQLVLTPNLVQGDVLTVDQINRVINFFDVYVGYKAIASGTRTGPGGRENLSRFTPGQTIQTRLKVTTQVRIGDL